MSDIFRELAIIAVLLLLNGLFSMSELAIIAAKRVRLERQAEEGSAGARAALAIAANPGDFLSTVQVGITLVGVIASVYGGATIAEQLAQRLADVPWLAEHAEPAALVIVVATITYLSVIVGELVPKRIALGNPERVAGLVARPMRLVSRVGAPLVSLLTGSTQLILRLFGVRGTPEPGLTEDEIHAVIEQGAEAGVVPEVEHDIVENVFRLGDRHVSSVMTVRADLQWLDAAASPSEIRAALAQGPRDWILVCEGDVEAVLGVAHASDLLSQCLDGRALAVREVVKEPAYVPTSTPVFRLLTTFRETRARIAVVLDEYGGIEGVVSMSDIVAELLGGLPTGDDSVEAPSIVANQDGSWTVDGGTDIADVEERLDLQSLDDDPRRPYRTLAGFMLSRFGRVPDAGEAITAAGFEFLVESIDGRRIGQVRVRRTSPGWENAQR